MPEKFQQPEGEQQWISFILDSEEAFAAIIEALSRARRPRLCYMSSCKQYVVLREIVAETERAGRR